ncbi:MAG: manganese efflux pump [Acidobacteria bacterium]|nr:MAG: manganese efflux pump [Acidobacteriota bacterium]
MPLLDTLVIALGLAMDAFAVAAGAGAGGRVAGRRGAFRIAFHFGLFQALMPVAGWLAGRSIAPLIRAFDHWIAMGLLGIVGGRMIAQSLRPRDGHEGGASPSGGDPSRGWTLVALSVATSIDALAVGLTLALIGVAIWQPAAVIGLVTGVLSLAGLQLGRRFGVRFGRTTEAVGGALLIAIGLRILVSHLAGG